MLRRPNLCGSFLSVYIYVARFITCINLFIQVLILYIYLSLISEQNHRRRHLRLTEAAKNEVSVVVG